MSIATQTPEGRSAYSPPKEEKLLDTPKVSNNLGHTSLSTVVTLPERSSPGVEEAIERVGPVYTFDNYVALEEQVAELDKQLALQAQELAEAVEKTETLRDTYDDLGLFPSSEETLTAIQANLSSEEERLVAISESIAAKQKVRDKFVEWQNEVKGRLEQQNDGQLQALLNGRVSRVPRLGALDRTLH